MEDFGAYTLAQIYALFSTGLAHFGLLLAYERDFFEHKDRPAAAGLLYATLVFVLVALVLLLGVTWMAREALARWVVGSPQHGTLVFWATCASGAVSLKGYYLTYLKNTGNARGYVVYSVDETVLGAALALFFVVGLKKGVIGMAQGQLVASLLIFTVLSWKFLRSLRLAFDWSALQGSLRISLPLTPRIFFGVLGTQMDKYLIRLLSSVGAVGIYGIGQKLAYVGFQYMTALQNVYAPRVYQHMFDHREMAGHAIGRYLTGFAYASIAVPLMIALFSDEIIRVLTPASFHGASTVVMVLSLYYASLFFGKIAGAQLIFTKRTYITSVLTLFGIGLNLVLGLLFIPRWGPTGAAWSTTLSGVVVAGVALVASQRYYHIAWEFGKLVRMYGVISASVVGLLALEAATSGYPVRLLLKAVGVASYLAVGVKLGILTRNSLMQFRAAFQRGHVAVG